jgi:glycoside/pentoside/hexuronide:cation symporter, GPH family
MKVNSLSQKELCRYSALALPTAFAGYPIYVLAPDYYATNYGVSLASLGLLLLGLRLFDSVQDPIIGLISDRYRNLSLWYMISASILVCSGVYWLFNIKANQPELWFAFCVSVTVFAYNILTINLNTLGCLWSQDDEAQIKISVFRESFGLLGLLMAVSLPSLLKLYWSIERSYLIYSIILCTLMLIAWLGFWPWLKRNHKRANGQELSLYSAFRSLNAIAPMTRLFFIVYGLSMLASSIPAVLVVFFIRDLLGADEYSGLFLFLYFFSGALALPFWKSISFQYGKYYTWIYAILLSVAAFVWAFFLKAGDLWQYTVICLCSGFAFGADLALPPSILADLIHKSQTEDHAAIQYSFLALCAKLSLTLASAIFLPLLSFAGFVPMDHNDAPVLFLLSAVYALIPCLVKLITAGMILRLSVKVKGMDTNEKIEIYRYDRSSHHA